MVEVANCVATEWPLRQRGLMSSGPTSRHHAQNGPGGAAGASQWPAWQSRAAAPPGIARRPCITAPYMHHADTFVTQA
jgi:hypothetical protein